MLAEGTLLIFTHLSVSTKITAPYKNPADVQQRAENVAICLEIMKTERVELYGIQAEGNSLTFFWVYCESYMRHFGMNGESENAIA